MWSLLSGEAEWVRERMCVTERKCETLLPLTVSRVLFPRLLSPHTTSPHGQTEVSSHSWVHTFSGSLPLALTHFCSCSPVSLSQFLSLPPLSCALHLSLSCPQSLLLLCSISPPLCLVFFQSCFFSAWRWQSRALLSSLVPFRCFTPFSFLLLCYKSCLHSSRSLLCPILMCRNTPCLFQILIVSSFPPSFPVSSIALLCSLP